VIIGIGFEVLRSTTTYDQPILRLMRRASASRSVLPASSFAPHATVPSGPLLVRFIAGFYEGGFDFRHLLVWVKQQFVIGMSDYHYRHEPILYGWRDDPNASATLVIKPPDKKNAKDCPRGETQTLLLGPRTEQGIPKQSEVCRAPQCR